MRRWFILILFASSWLPTRAVDVKRFELLKGRYYYQFEENIARIQTNNAYRFIAAVYASQPGSVLDASVTTPKAATLPLMPARDGDPIRANEKFDDQFHLDVTYSSGKYVFTIDAAADGAHAMPLTLTGDTYPNPPILKNLPATQTIPYNGYFELSWNPFVDGTEGDFIQVVIVDSLANNVFQTSDFGEIGALDGRATKAILPPRTLQTNQTYECQIQFCKILPGGGSAYPGAPGRVGYIARTDLVLRSIDNGTSPAVDKVEIWKTQRTQQLEEGAPFLQTKPFEFSAQVNGVSTGSVASATISIPLSTNEVLQANNDASQFSFSDNTLTNLTDFQAKYRAGAYSLGIAHGSVTDNVAETFPGDSFPPAPQLIGATNYSTHPANLDLPITWNSWAGTKESDFIRAELFDENGKKVWDTSGWTGVKHLRGNATATKIPANNFIPGRNYEVQVTFFRTLFSDTTGLSGAIVFGGIASRTKFAFATVPADATSYSVSQGQTFWQRGANLYESTVPGAYTFQAAVTASAVGAVTNVQLNIPANGSFALRGDPFGSDLSFSATENVASSFFAHYPPGIYTFIFETLDDGLRTATINLPATPLPPIPQVLNFSTLPTNNPAQTVKISWLPWFGFQTNTDIVHFSFFDAAGAAIGLGTNIVTDGAITNVLITNDKLKPSRSYIGKIRFERTLPAPDSPTYPGPRPSLTLYSETSFNLSTLDAAKPMNISAFALSLTRQLQLRLTALTGRKYRLEISTDLSAWTPFQTNTATGTTLTYSLPTDPPQAYFRPVLLP